MSEIGAIKDREFSKFVESPSRGAPNAATEILVGNQDSEPVPSKAVVSIPELFKMAVSSGMIESDSFDEIIGGRLSENNWILEFYTSGFSLYQMLITLTYPTSFSIQKRPFSFPMLQENGDYILQENGDKLLVQGLIP